ncbi:MAG: hypothetical protein FGF52_02795, partial [Candidatus Brockarchaeota archaeon]|nr:hypothetical protein [Candidatus Brockarchaeota archaeon]
KGAKYVSMGKLSAEKVAMGIRAVVFDETITRILIHEREVLILACRLRRLLSDYIDCLILSSALSQCDALISEDTDIQSLRRNREFQELLKMVNSEFKIFRLAEIV